MITQIQKPKGLDELLKDYKPEKHEEEKKIEVAEGMYTQLEEHNMLTRDYKSLLELCLQYDIKPAEMLKRKSFLYRLFFGQHLKTENGSMTKIDIACRIIETPDKSLEIPETLTELKELNCSCSNLKKLYIPDTLTQLTKLSCEYNSLTDLQIPDTLTQLKEIYCRSNALTKLEIPPTLTQLQYLHCDNNHLTTLQIPDTLTQLTRLYCYNNHLTQLIIPPTLTQLQYLHCENNPLTQLIIPKTLTQIKRIISNDNVRITRK